MDAEIAPRLERLSHQPLAGLCLSDPIFEGLSTIAAERLRAHVFVRHATGVAPLELREAAREQLRYGDHALTVAAAALMLGNAAEAWEFEEAAERLLAHDVAFDIAAARPPNCATALDVLHFCAKNAGATPSCCGDDTAPADGVAPFAPIDLSPLADVTLEDQEGERRSFGELFFDRPAFLTFFYTRCLVPEKCSATIHRLGRLATLARADPRAGAPMIAAVTYDPAYDSSQRLRAYGALREVVFDERTKLLRTLGDFESIRQMLALGVGYGPSTVNSHRLEAYVISPRRVAVRAIRHRAWAESEALRALRAAAGGG